MLLALFASLPSAAPQKLRKREAIPDYALTYAPVSYLYSGEGWFPSDITIHLNNTIPEVDYVATGDAGSVTVDTLDTYTSDVYLTSKDNVEGNPAWLLSDYGIPDTSGMLQCCTGTDHCCREE